MHHHCLQANAKRDVQKLARIAYISLFDAGYKCVSAEQARQLGATPIGNISPTLFDNNGKRYIDEKWVQKARRRV
jgi:hypothetical protein